MHARLDAGARLPIEDEHIERAVYVVEGSIGCDGRDFHAGTLVVLRPGAAASLTAAAPARVMIVGGARLDGERHIYWNFVSSEKARLERAKSDWKSGRFPSVPGDEVEFIPLPETREHATNRFAAGVDHGVTANGNAKSNDGGQSGVRRQAARRAARPGGQPVLFAGQRAPRALGADLGRRARRDRRAEMQKTLALPPVAAAHDEFAALLKSWNALGTPPDNGNAARAANNPDMQRYYEDQLEQRRIILRVVNRLWAQTGYHFQDATSWRCLLRRLPDAAGAARLSQESRGGPRGHQPVGGRT